MNQHIYAEFSNVFFDIDMETAWQDCLSNIDTLGFARILSIFGFLDTNSSFSPDNDIIKNLLLYYSSRESEMIPVYTLKDEHLVTRQGLLIGWKYLLKSHTENSIVNKQRISENFIKLIKMVTIIHESYMEYEGEEYIPYLASNSVLNYYDSAAHQYVRSYYIFILNSFKSEKLQLYTEQIRNRFNEKYGIHLNEYIYAVAGMSFWLSKKLNEDWNKSEIIFENWSIDPKDLPPQSPKSKELFNKTLESLSFSLEEGKQWADEYIDANFDFKLFEKKPLLKINSDTYIPIEKKLFQNSLFHSLYVKIKDSHSKNEIANFRTNYGYLFEAYIVEIVQKVPELSELKYSSIPEFYYGPTNNLSSDIYLTYEDTVMVIEAKSFRVRYDLDKGFSKKESVKKSTDKLIFSPLLQAVEAMNLIVSNEVNQQLNDEKVYYYVTVTMDNIPYSNFDGSEFLNKFKQINQLKTGGFYSFSVEELELFLEVICSTNAPFGYFLEKYRTTSEPSMSFKNYINKFKGKTNGPVSQLMMRAQDDLNEFFMNLE
ncbi:hypothetical protein J7E78_01275 [Paenibacillus polymyxa]|uniref:hypothetical protein n=1 Tax=Paenibacillus polymyxa TaxID=1406 RepID=UPI001BE6ED33|nr:hypothetical protein [Paenibacillus polymyxa]MBT2282183.1 hypothetical protein [Paenibacillus polymyxa]